MKTFLEQLHEDMIDESVIKHIIAVRDKLNNLLPKEILPNKPKEEINGNNGLHVKPLDHVEAQRFKHHIDFQPTHLITINNVQHVVGRENGQIQIYKRDAGAPNPTHGNNSTGLTKVHGFRLLHEHPDIIGSRVGQAIYKQHRQAFQKVPLTATKHDIAGVMSLKTSDDFHGVPVKQMQLMALKHPQGGANMLHNMITNPDMDQTLLKKALIQHRLSRKNATAIIHSPHITHQDIIKAAHDRLAQP